LKFTIIEILDLKAQSKPLPGGDERQNLYTMLKDKKSQRKMNCICIQLTGYLKLAITLTNWTIGDWNSPGIRTYRGWPENSWWFAQFRLHQNGVSCKVRYLN
jgi:hypothetical protein